MFRTQLSVVVPAYNEELRLETPLRDICSYCSNMYDGFEVIVVDDGSQDRTSELVRDLSASFPEIKLIRLAKNRGKGYAVRTGVVNANGDYILFTDADGATPIAEIARLEAALGQGASLAIGSRVLNSSETHVDARFYRRLMGRTYHMLVSALTVRGIQDTQCGFKLLHAKVAHDLFSRMRMDGFSFDVEVLLMAQRQGYTIAEVPVNWMHQPGSRVNLLLDSLAMARDLFVIKTLCLHGAYDHHHLAPWRHQHATNLTS